LFGSYARGEANSNSDVDIYCEKWTIKTLIDQNILIEELETALNKKVDVIFNTSKMSDYFKEQIMDDLIKLC
jgi:predicted nucleotidyltransferase